MKMNIPPCPMCGTSKHATARADGLYYCTKHGMYDSDPTEGGDYHDRDVSRRIERQERRGRR